MKKIDLHIHTITTISDSDFTFCMDSLKRYVTEANLDAIAITNHNIFNVEQFRDINESLPITVFPGIEINLDNCHILLLSDGSDIEDFKSRSDEVLKRISQVDDSITVDDLKNIYGDLNRYLTTIRNILSLKISGFTPSEEMTYLVFPGTCSSALLPT